MVNVLLISDEVTASFFWIKEAASPMSEKKLKKLIIPLEMLKIPIVSTDKILIRMKLFVSRPKKLVAKEPKVKLINEDTTLFFMFLISILRDCASSIIYITPLNNK